MRFILSIAVALAFALGAITACTNSAAPLKANNSSKPSTSAAHTDDAPRITLADAKKEFDAGTAIFVDTRAEVAYKDGHIKGAINIPAEAMELRYKEIPTDKKIIAYCS
jgi:3-mercaptopyruvate sulfurtransferase SseA